MEIQSRTVQQWADDFVEEQLNLDKLNEQATVVVELSRRKELPNSRHTLNLELSVGTRRSSSVKPAREFSELSLSELLEMLYRESRIRIEDASTQHNLVIPAQLAASAQRAVPSVGLPLLTGPGPTVGQVLSERTSVRHYASSPVSLEQVGTMLYYAQKGDANDWPEERALPLTFLVIGWRVENLNPGVYVYDPQQHALRLSAEAPRAEKAVELFVQPEFAMASLVVWIAGNLAAACLRHGAFGHRLLLLRAGAAAHRLWMAALASGLSGTLVSGVVPGAARNFGLDGYTQASLLAFAGGHEIERAKGPANPGRAVR